MALTREEIDQYKDQMLSIVPDDGSSIGNVRLFAEFRRKTRSQLAEDDLWTIRNSLVEERVLGRGRGRGGSVFRLVDGQTSPERCPPTKRERDLYDPVLAVIRKDWAQANGMKSVVERRRPTREAAPREASGRVRTSPS